MVKNAIQASASTASVQQNKAQLSFSNLLEDEEDSGSDSRKVPDMSGNAASNSTPAAPKSNAGRKRSTQPADKEHKRMKRLLRNRVSAQQARERKKAYLSDLEVRIKDLEQRNAELEERVSTLQQENAMLRKVIRSTSLRPESSAG